MENYYRMVESNLILKLKETTWLSERKHHDKVRKYIIELQVQLKNRFFYKILKIENINSKLESGIKKATHVIGMTNRNSQN